MEKPSGSLQQSFSLFINYHHKKCKGRCLVTVDHSERREGAGGPSLDAASSRNGLSDSRREAQRTTSERLRAGGCLLPCIRGTADSRRVFWRATRNGSRGSGQMSAARSGRTRSQFSAFADT